MIHRRVGAQQDESGRRNLAGRKGGRWEAKPIAEAYPLGVGIYYLEVDLELPVPVPQNPGITLDLSCPA